MKIVKLITRILKDGTKEYAPGLWRVGQTTARGNIRVNRIDAKEHRLVSSAMWMEQVNH